MEHIPCHGTRRHVQLETPLVRLPFDVLLEKDSQLRRDKVLVHRYKRPWVEWLLPLLQTEVSLCSWMLERKRKKKVVFFELTPLKYVINHRTRQIRSFFVRCWLLLFRFGSTSSMWRQDIIAWNLKMRWVNTWQRIVGKKKPKEKEKPW